MESILSSPLEDGATPTNDPLTEAAKLIYKSGEIVGSDTFHLPDLIDLFKAYEEDSPDI